MILADEINRTPPKTQAALLEAMQERQVTAGAPDVPPADPFFVLATQNPIEQEGDLPAAGGPARPVHVQREGRLPVAGGRGGDHAADEDGQCVAGTPRRCSTVRRSSAFRNVVRQVVVADHVFAFAVDLVRMTRPREPESPKFIPDLLAWVRARGPAST